MTDESWVLKTIEREAESRARQHLLTDPNSSITYFGIAVQDVRKLIRFWEKTKCKRYVPGVTEIIEPPDPPPSQ